MSSWSWRTKPRSISKTITWFPCFAELKGENWESKAKHLSARGTTVHPVRRAYIYAAHGEEDIWLSTISYEEYITGCKDSKETESNGRNDKATFEFYGFGYVNAWGNVCVTQVGQKILEGTFDQEDYLKQLLKLRLPNPTYKKKEYKNKRSVSPLFLITKAFAEYETLNRSELALLFGCEDDDEYQTALDAIRDFKSRYQTIENKNSVKEVGRVFSDVFVRHYGKMDNQASSYYSYAEALGRTLVYTGLFSLSGRSIASKLRVAEHSKEKMAMLQEKFLFQKPELFSDIDAYMEWYGGTDTVTLPWENPTERKRIISKKADLLMHKIQSADGTYTKSTVLSVTEIEELVKHAGAAKDVNELKEVETVLSDAIVSHNEEYFTHVLSKTKEERKAILEKFEDILDNEDMSALWLEVNTWKSLAAMRGEHGLKRNFKMEDDLTPRSFAPGIGNTPDMELHYQERVVITEVSLMTGVRQWEHEASSVIDHVLNGMRRYPGREVTGLFLSSQIHMRTMWQFFILNRESWMEYPVPVVPLSIEQYMDIVTCMYHNDREIGEFLDLLDMLSKETFSCSSFAMWKVMIQKRMEEWKIK